MNDDRVLQAISLVDLTDLSDDCTDADVDHLCGRASRHATAAVCVWPDFVAQAADRLTGSSVRVATVVNFPSGDERPFATRVLTERAIDDGADEIDVVLPYRSFSVGDRVRPGELLEAVRAATEGRAVMKVILETGELVESSAVADASRFAIDHGADFIKTSTGKSPVSATIDAVEVMLAAIAEAPRPIGLKPSGGIRTADDAFRYLDLGERVMGAAWIGPDTFRFGASGLLDALLAELGESSGHAAHDPQY